MERAVLKAFATQSHSTLQTGLFACSVNHTKINKLLFRLKNQNNPK
jgi:hypothetical protein